MTPRSLFLIAILTLAEYTRSDQAVREIHLPSFSDGAFNARYFHISLLCPVLNLPLAEASAATNSYILVQPRPKFLSKSMCL